MFCDREVVALQLDSEPVVILRDQCGHAVAYVRQRTEYGETVSQCLERAGRIAAVLTTPLARVDEV